MSANFVVIGADLALRYFWVGDGYTEVLSKISGYQKHTYLCPLAENMGVQLAHRAALGIDDTILRFCME